MIFNKLAFILQMAVYWCRLTTACCSHKRVTQIAILGSIWDFGTVTKAQVSLCKCVDSPEPSPLAQNSIKSPLESQFKKSCAGSDGDLLLFCARSEGSGESTHWHRPTWAFVTVPKSHVLPQMAICVLFTPAAKIGESTHLCRYSHWTLD